MRGKGMLMRRRRRFVAAFAAFLLAMPIGLAAYGGIGDAFASPVSRAGQWSGIANEDILVSDTVTPLSNGVTQHEVVSNNTSGTDQNIEYFAEIDMSSEDVQLVAGYGNNSADSWSLTRATDQAKAFERDNPGKTVVAAINADFFNMATGEPMGALVMNGEV